MQVKFLESKMGLTKSNQNKLGTYIETKSKSPSFKNKILSLTFFVFLLSSFSLEAQFRAPTQRQPKNFVTAKAELDYNLPAASNEIKIMTYNVENLFDTEHDDKKQDWEFLPKSSPYKKNCKYVIDPYKGACYNTDWTPTKLRLKLKQIKKAIQAQGSMPDVIALQEVENESVVAQLGRELGYSYYVMTNGPDRRGIDVALLYKTDKLKFLEAMEQPLAIPNLSSRNLLVANFSFKNVRTESVLGVFVNHWPSQSKSTAVRIETAKELRAFIDAQAHKYGLQNYHSVALGDFNTIDADKPSPFSVLMDPSWVNKMGDVQSAFDQLNLDIKDKMPRASYFYRYKATWDRLDRIFVSHNMMDRRGVDVVLESFRVLAPIFITEPFSPNQSTKSLFKTMTLNVPKRYNHNASTETKAGYSDHFPLVIKVRIQ